MEKICYIVGAAPDGRPDFHPRQEDLIIGADGGLRTLKRSGIRADIGIGDFDSFTGKPNVREIFSLPTAKNDTDVLAAIRLGLQRGYTRFEVYGATGGRADHTFANLQALSYVAEQGGRGTLHAAAYTATVFCNGMLELDARESGTVSVFSLSDVSEGVTLIGLKYPLTNYTMTRAYPIGVSNEFIGMPASAEVKKGTLIVYVSKERSVK